MEQPNHAVEMLELIGCPAFAVENGTITYSNRLAAGLVTAGASIEDYLRSNADEYSAMESGTMYLSVTVDGFEFNASVSRMQGYDVFILDSQQSQTELRTAALAARELRNSLSNILISSDRLLPEMDRQNPAVMEQTARFNQSICRMLRLVGNMSDAAKYVSHSQGRQTQRDIVSIVREIIEKASVLAESTGIRMQFSCPEEEILCLVDSEKLERGIYNMLSNALKFTPSGGTVTVTLARSGSKLRLQVRDTGSGIPDDIISSVFSRHLRPLTLEDSRHGLGLGMVLIRGAAIAHEGTVLIQRLPEGGTCVTMTLSIRKHAGNTLCSPVLIPDYAGGFDHGMIELSDVLPAEKYNYQ